MISTHWSSFTMAIPNLEHGTFTWIYAVITWLFLSGQIYPKSEGEKKSSY